MPPPPPSGHICKQVLYILYVVYNMYIAVHFFRDLVFSKFQNSQILPSLRNFLPMERYFVNVKSSESPCTKTSVNVLQQEGIFTVFLPCILIVSFSRFSCFGPDLKCYLENLAVLVQDFKLRVILTSWWKGVCHVFRKKKKGGK